MQLHIGLKKENMNDEEGGIWWGEGLFHDADITVDAIVGLPWLIRTVLSSSQPITAWQRCGAPGNYGSCGHGSRR